MRKTRSGLTPSAAMAARSSSFCTSTAALRRASRNRNKPRTMSPVSRAFGLREVKTKPRPASAFSFRMGKPSAATEPITVGSSAT